MKVLQAGVL